MVCVLGVGVRDVCTYVFVVIVIFVRVSVVLVFTCDADMAMKFLTDRQESNYWII